MSDDSIKTRINPGYAVEQLIRALRLGVGGSARASRWEAVVEGMWTGRLHPGSRTPVENTPSWVTLEVATGGFATGRFAAGGRLQSHEESLDATYVKAASTRQRAGLNAWFLTDNGQAWLRDRLESGGYRINVPEEGALLTITWLLMQGDAERAESILQEIVPWAGELRFYPVPAAHPRSTGGVAVRTTGDVVRLLRAEKPHRQVQTMKEAVLVWAPRVARAVALFRDQGASDWNDRARAILQDYEQTRRTAPLSKKVDDPRENFARLRAFATKALLSPLTVGEQHAVERIVTAYVSKHGVPGSPEHAARYAEQVRAVGAPLHADLAHELYATFRRRRSLLLLNLESQVQFKELPWVFPLDRWLEDTTAVRRATRALLETSVTTVIREYPQTITPNRLVKELRALSSSAGLELPLVEELASDIFMGTFTGAFVESAQISARLLTGTLYQRYYDLPFGEVLRLQLPKEQRKDSPEFAALCARLANPATGSGSRVARNGTVIEQAQILTTHNLAALIEGLDLRHALDWPALAKTCFDWVCVRLQLTLPGWRTKLRSVKNNAYAWRQMLVYLSLATSPQVDAFLDHASAHLEKQPEPFRTTFAPALLGLRAAARGQPTETNGGRRFLGWSVGPHWLMS